MSFHHASTLTDYARIAIDLRIRMAETASGVIDRAYAREVFASQILPDSREPNGHRVDRVERVVDAVARAAQAAWNRGETFVLAPAMTAIIAAAAEALDLTGDLLTDDAAPCDTGVLFLPEPIHHRRPDGTTASIGALTWAKSATETGKRFWLICSYGPLHDPDDPDAATARHALDQAPNKRAGLGPYLLNDIAYLPIARPIPARHATRDDTDTDWASTPEGRYVITDDGTHTQIPTAILCSFWRVQAQPLTIAPKPPLDRPTRRRAHRASISHQTRVVMLRRTSPATDPGEREARWHYRVRFFVRGHWRHLVDKHGNPYRIWVNAYIKGPDGAPLLLGETVSVLAR